MIVPKLPAEANVAGEDVVGFLKTGVWEWRRGDAKLEAEAKDESLVGGEYFVREIVDGSVGDRKVGREEVGDAGFIYSIYNRSRRIGGRRCRAGWVFTGEKDA